MKGSQDNKSLVMFRRPAAATLSV